MRDAGTGAEARSLLPLAALLVASAAVLAPAARAQTMVFTDVTAAAGLAITHTNPLDNVAAFTTGGLAVGDFDRDGWPDLFVLGGWMQPNHLYINDGDGTFTESAADWGVDDSYVGSGIAVGDFDADGWLDVYVSDLGAAPLWAGRGILYRNVGGKWFSDIAAPLGLQSEAQPRKAKSAVWGDIDNDGDLDLFSSAWETWGSSGNRLYRNDGTVFTEVTFTNFTEFGFVTTKGFSPLLVDVDFDRDLDLLIAADFETSRYFENVGGGVFADRTASSGTALDSNGMGSAVADFDLDGVYDWYVTSIYHAGGFGYGTGNMLYRGLGGHVYEEVSVPAGVKDGGWGWGTLAVDLDHDGLEDIVENNGWHYTGSGETQFLFEQAYLWRNEGNMQFTEMAVASGLDYALDGRGLVKLDYDRDGDMDLAFYGNNAPLRLFRNDLSGPDTHWLKVLLDSDGQPGVAPDGYGALITVDAAGHPRQMRHMDGGASYMSHSELVAHFGLGAASSVHRLTVRWPDGHVQVRTDVAADAVVRITCCGPWEDLGFGLAGAGGAPELVGEGSLEGDGPLDLHLSNAAPSTTAWLVLGLGADNLPFYGGTLVPTLTPPALQLPLPTSVAGGLSVGGIWPTGVPGGLGIYFQYWVVDPTGPFGFTASNALKGTTP